MLNDSKIAGLLSDALFPVLRSDRGWPNTARLPWWVTEEMVNFGRAEAMTINSSLEADFLVVHPTQPPALAGDSKHFFYGFLDVMLRTIQLPHRIKDARA
jgi:hypothetical protein